MPRDNKSPLIQKIAKKAHIAFKDFKSATNRGNDVDKHTELVSLVTAIRAADLKLTPRNSKTSSVASAGLQSPPVSYMHICETEVFSMGVFLLKSGASLPLHDHPGMNGMLKVRKHIMPHQSHFYTCCVPYIFRKPKQKTPQNNPRLILSTVIPIIIRPPDGSKPLHPKHDLI